MDALEPVTGQLHRVKKETITNVDELVETCNKLLWIDEKHAGVAAYMDKENTKYVNVTMMTDHELPWTDKMAAKNDKNVIETLKTFHKLLWTDRKPVDIAASVDAGDTKYVNVTTKTNHELLLDNNVDAGNTSNADEMEKFYHKLWRTATRGMRATLLRPCSCLTVPISTKAARR